MGGSPTTSEHVSSYYQANRSITRATSAREVFKSSSLNDLLDPAKLKNGFRESCDSVDSPNSRAVAIGFDDTGSMGRIPFSFIQEGFPRFIKMIQGGALGYDPHILFAAIGDAYCDDAPLEVSQFEADTRMLDQLRLFYLEGGGGGNDGESYEIPWYFLAKHTKIDCFNKRGEKGIYISVGDDKPHDGINTSTAKKIFGRNESIERSYKTTELRDMALEKWNLFHIILPEDGYGSDRVPETWRKYLGTHVISLEDHRYVAEALATILKLQNGFDRDEVFDMIEDARAKKVIRQAFKGFEIYKDGEAIKSGKAAGVEFI
ncbi:MAG: hypothetical protein IKR04_07845 [Clostridia bacterium]|nr:hypothetical protein [Clostridia bacterium]